MSDVLKAAANALAACCREGRSREGLDTLYHSDCVSVEAAIGPGASSRETAGIDGIRVKHDWWQGAMEVHESATEGPFLHGDDRFGLIFEVDATDKASGARIKMKELGIYTVDDAGKIIREEFFYSM